MNVALSTDVNVCSVCQYKLMVLHTKAHNHKQQVAIILLSTRNPIYVYVSHHACKSNGDETGDVDFLPWCNAYFGFSTGGASILNQPNCTTDTL